jgi:hypothetical protein
MKKLTSFGAVGFAALIAMLAMVGFQSPAQAYPDASIDLSVDHQTVYSGESFTATARSDVRCEWTLEWGHQKRHSESSSGQDFVTSFRAGNVKTTTHIPLKGTCAYDAGDGQQAQPSTWTRTIDITVEPRSAEVSAPGNGENGNGAQAGGAQAAGANTGAAGSDLPGTGGPNRLFLAGGLLLVISGATAVTVARRRAEQAELRAARV